MGGIACRAELEYDTVCVLDLGDGANALHVDMLPARSSATPQRDTSAIVFRVPCVGCGD